MPAIPKSALATISSAGTAVQITSTSEIIQAGQQVEIHADINAGLVYIGNSGVSSSNGFLLDDDDHHHLLVSHEAWDISDLWVDATQNNATVSIFWFGEA